MNFDILVLAIPTFFMAVATMYLAWEQRRGRIEAGHARTRVALRAALTEQLENARRWHRCDPNRGDEALQGLRSAGPSFEATTRLLSGFRSRPAYWRPRSRGEAYGVDAAIVDRVQWEVPQVWPERMRAGTQVSENTYLEAPRFPSDAAYAGCSVGARDARAYKLQATAQASLISSLAEGVPHGFGDV